MLGKYSVLLSFWLVCLTVISGSFAGDIKIQSTVAADDMQHGEVVGRLLEEGRTLVHHAVKRFMVILPVVFFKLGVAFTLLVLVSLAVINNGFIGFLLLVVGLSSVLARFQEARRPPVYNYGRPVLPYGFLDRSDNSVLETKKDSEIGVTSTAYNAYQTYRPYNSYNAYYNQKLR